MGIAERLQRERQTARMKLLVVLGVLLVLGAGIVVVALVVKGERKPDVLVGDASGRKWQESQVSPRETKPAEAAKPGTEPLDLANQKIRDRYELLPIERRRLLMEINDCILKDSTTNVNLQLIWRAWIENQDLFDSRLLPWALKASGDGGADEVMRIHGYSEDIRRTVRLEFIGACWAEGETADTIRKAGLNPERTILTPQQIVELARKCKASGVASLATEKEKRFAQSHKLIAGIP